MACLCKRSLSFWPVKFQAPMGAYSREYDSRVQSQGLGGSVNAEVGMVEYRSPALSVCSQTIMLCTQAS